MSKYQGHIDWKKVKGAKEAGYELIPQTPYAFEFWQFTENGKVDGIAGLCDIDIQFMK